MLDTFRQGIDSVRGSRTVALSRFRLLIRRTCSSSSMDLQKTELDAERVGKLEKMLDGLETLMGDMQEFVLFLEGYPRICWQPYITYLILGKVMFGRQMEMETVTSFLLRPEFNPGVLPIVGAARSGKSTIVEHVCLDERVHDLGAGNVAALKSTGVIKHQDRTASSHGRSLAVIELDKDMDEETWERLYSSASGFMEHGSKIIITSRSEKIAAFGTVQALRLKYLTEEAYWYFFKALAFGSANPEDLPKLASIGMEIAVLLKDSFLGANIVGSLMRANLNVEFWSRVLKCLKDFTSKYLLIALSTVIQRYRRSKAEETEHKLQQLQRLLLRIDATVEEAEGRYITNQAMLLQLETLRQGMYKGHYMLDTFKYRGHGEDDEVSAGHAVALPRFSPAKLFFPFPVTSNTKNMTIDAETVKKLEKMLDRLDTLMGDMEEFVMFLEGYPRIFRQPYSTYLILDKVMFGRQMEKETIINFLLRPEAAGDGNPGVLPVVGLARVGKSTLVEHVCLDERVRGYFSSIVFFTGGDIIGAGNTAALRNSGAVKHQDLTAASPSHGRSLVVIELDGEMEEETWRRLYSSAASIMEHGSKIIVASRSEKVTSFGTAQALRLKFLPQEAYWYFFKTLTFGSANPDDHPKLASLGMEIAAMMKGSFLGANIVGGMMRDNLNTQFWRRLFQRLREFTNKHLIAYGEHPTDRIQKGHPVHIWRMARTWHPVTICKIYQDRSYQQHAVPKLTLQDIVTGCATDQAVFGTLAWRSSIPPYYTYLATCASQTATRCPMVSKKRPRQARV
ncbi:hypothetical protein QOZ80_1AG0031440 [Eleusine coracana subsp. coracana]|nr:hypothetical protein QOZ80_1AG0031440 [Eleusine coracana subsp. coracana]